MASTRFRVESFSAAGSLDFVFDRQMPNWYGLQVQFEADGNFAATILAKNSLGTLQDITSLMTGGAGITSANLFFQAHFVPETVRINVTSVQSTKHVNVSVGA